MVTASDIPVGSVSRYRWQGRAAAVALVALLFVAVTARILTFEIRADEQLYIPPAVLMESGRIYADFFYNHTPYSAFLYRAVYLLTGAQDLVGAARLTTVLAWAATLAVVWWASLKLSRSGPMAMFCTVSVAANVYLLTVVGMTATNNFLQLGLVYAGLALFALAALEPQHRRIRMFGAGVFLAIAVGIKVSAGYAVLPVVLAAVFLPAGVSLRERFTSMVLPLALGGLIGGLPLFAIVLADPVRFLDHVIGYHTGPHVAYWTEMRHTEPGLAFGLGGRLQLAFEVWLQSTNLLILAAIALVGGLALPNEGRHPVRLIAGLVAITGVIAILCFLPKPAFPQYFILPLAGFLLVPPLLWRNLDPGQAAVARPALAGLVVLIIILGAPRLAEPVLSLAKGAPTTAQRVEDGGIAIRDAIRVEDGGRIATFFPVYPLQAGLPVYPEFATGPFAYRVVPMAAPEDLTRFVIAGPSDVAPLFDADPPAALLTGLMPDLEAPLEAWAEANGYRIDPSVDFNTRYGRARLWVPAD